MSFLGKNEEKEGRERRRREEDREGSQEGKKVNVK